MKDTYLAHNFSGEAPLPGVFSVDVEDWYQGIELPMSTWEQFESRIERSMQRLLNLMEAHKVTATCFVLGKVAEEHPQLVQRIDDAGHEIGTHGYSHEKVYNLTPERFRAELRHSIDVLESITGKPVRGHRAPYFSITEDVLWALDILVEEGIQYDSSIHPVLNWRYGIPDADRTPSLITTPKGRQLLEVPVSTVPLPRLNIPVGGGAYFRIYPYRMQRFLLRRLQKRGDHIGFYIHPWEVDANHPHLDLPFRVRATHYYNLKSTYPKLNSLFSDFNFRSYQDMFF